MKYDGKKNHKNEIVDLSDNGQDDTPQGQGGADSLNQKLRVLNLDTRRQTQQEGLSKKPLEIQAQPVLVTREDGSEILLIPGDRPHADTVLSTTKMVRREAAKAEPTERLDESEQSDTVWTKEEPANKFDDGSSLNTVMKRVQNNWSGVGKAGLGIKPQMSDDMSSEQSYMVKVPQSSQGTFIEAASPGKYDLMSNLDSETSI